MSRYYHPEVKENPAKKPPHPVWRGIGCGLMIIIPAISYIAANYFVTNANLYKWMVLPGEMVVKVFSDPLILIKILYAIIFAAGLYLILTVITFIVNRFFGPPRYGPQDIPLDEVERGKPRRR
jgi:hypothetical protein